MINICKLLLYQFEAVMMLWPGEDEDDKRDNASRATVILSEKISALSSLTHFIQKIQRQVEF